jgi:hypothetical protein
MDCSLFMADQYPMEWGILELVKKREYGSTGIIKESIHPFLLQTFNNDLSAGLFHKDRMRSVSLKDRFA